MNSPKFLLDGMLGKLTRWLRIFGFDAKYGGVYSDEGLITLALNERRVLLTRDINLCERANRRTLEPLLIKGQSKIEKLVEVAKRFSIKLEIDPARSRCSSCNTILMQTKKDVVKGRVPSLTYNSYEKFWICKNCNKIFWKGAHWKNIEHVKEEVNKMLNFERLGKKKIKRSF